MLADSGAFARAAQHQHKTCATARADGCPARLARALRTPIHARAGRRHLRIALEGNIAAGKSTLLRVLEDSLDYIAVPEPLSKWQVAQVPKPLNLYPKSCPSVRLF